MSDRLRIQNLAFHAYHGMLPEEALHGQRYEVDVELRLDLADAGRTDDLQKTVNYADVVDLVSQIATAQQRFDLVEALAEEIADRILRRWASVSSVLVRVRKPNPPVAADFAGLEIEIERHRAR